MAVQVDFVAVGWNVCHLSRCGPYVQHIYTLVVGGTLIGVLGEVVVVYHHVLARLPSEVSDDAEALPCEVGTKTTKPWGVTVLAQEYGVVGLVIHLGDVAVLVVPHRLSCTRIYACIAYLVELT